MIFKKIIYLFLLSLANLAKLIGKIFFKDVDVFFRRYPVLNTAPDTAWHNLGASVEEMFAYHFAKRPFLSRFILFFSVIIGFSVLGLNAFMAYQQTHILQSQLNHFNQVLAQQAAYELRTSLLLNNQAEMATIAATLMQEKTITGLTIYNSHQSIIQAYGSHATEAFHKQTLESNQESHQKSALLILMETMLSDAKTAQHYTLPIKQNDLLLGYIALSFNYSSLLVSLQIKTFQYILLTTLTALSIGLMAAFYISHLLFRSLSKLSMTMENLQHINEGQNKHDIKKNPHHRQDELQTFMESMNNLNKGLLQKDKVQSIFSRYVSSQVANQVLQDLDNIEGVKLGGEHVMASVFFADIVGFTSLSETLSPQEISELLNVYFSKIIQVVKFCNGRVDKFIGDCAMVVFGVPEKNPQHAFYCIACGWMILQLVSRLNDEREAQGLVTVEFRIGANSGMMLAGNMGSAERMEYTVVGDSVNLASRLSGSGEPGELIITEDVLVEQGLEGIIQTEIKDLIKLRGKKLPVKILNVKDILSSFKEEMLNEIPKIIATKTAP